MNQQFYVPGGANSTGGVSSKGAMNGPNDPVVVMSRRTKQGSHDSMGHVIGTQNTTAQEYRQHKGHSPKVVQGQGAKLGSGHSSQGSGHKYGIQGISNAGKMHSQS
jgi:hypothetical protein